MALDVTNLTSSALIKEALLKNYTFEESFKNANASANDNVILPGKNDVVSIWKIEDIPIKPCHMRADRIITFIKEIENNERHLRDKLTLNALAILYGLSLCSDCGKYNVMTMLTEALREKKLVAPFVMDEPLNDDLHCLIKSFFSDEPIQEKNVKGDCTSKDTEVTRKKCNSIFSDYLQYAANKDFPASFCLTLALGLGEFFRASLGKDRNKVRNRQRRFGKKIGSIAGCSIPSCNDDVKINEFPLLGILASSAITHSSKILPFLAAIVGYTYLLKSENYVNLRRSEESGNLTWYQTGAIQQSSLGPSLLYYRMAPIKFITEINDRSESKKNWIHHLVMPETMDALVACYAYYGFYANNNHIKAEQLEVQPFGPLMRCFNQNWLSTLSHSKSGQLNFLLKALGSKAMIRLEDFHAFKTPTPASNRFDDYIQILNHILKILFQPRYGPIVPFQPPMLTKEELLQIAGSRADPDKTMED